MKLKERLIIRFGYHFFRLSQAMKRLVVRLEAILVALTPFAVSFAPAVFTLYAIGVYGVFWPVLYLYVVFGLFVLTFVRTVGGILAREQQRND